MSEAEQLSVVLGRALEPEKPQVVSTRRISSYENQRLAARRNEILSPGYYVEVDAFTSWRDSDIQPIHKKFAEEYEPIAGPWDDALSRACSAINIHPFIVLLGPRGTGKTQMAACILRKISQKGRWVKYSPLLDFFRELRSTFKDKAGVDEAAFVQKWKRLDGIALDEIHDRGESEWENRTFTNLIDARYGAIRPTILIANFSPDGFAEHVGSSIVSRVHEIGIVIECTWPSFRQRQAAE